MSFLAGLFAGALELAGAGLQLLRLKPVKTSPLLIGPVHTYPDAMTSMVTYYQLHCCTKCSLFNERRAAYTDPPCKEKLPKVIVELP